MKRLKTLSTSCLFLCLGAVVASAGELPKQFTLGKYIPDDVWLYMHGVHNPERAWLTERWSRVFESLKATGLDRDLLSMIASKSSEEQQSKQKAQIEKWTKLLKQVHYGVLVEQEYAYSQRLTKKGGAELLFLAKGKAGSGEQNATALVNILEALAELKEELELERSVQGTVTIWTLSDADDSEGVSIQFLRKGDVLGLVMGEATQKQVVELLQGKRGNQSILTSKRFQQAMAEAKSPEDFLSFFDLQGFTSELRVLVNSEIAAQIEGEGEAEGEQPKTGMVAAILKGIDLCSFMDYTIVTKETVGFSERIHELTRLRPAKDKCPIAACMTNRRAFKKFDEFIPADATGFSVNASIDLESLYDVIIEFVQNDLPGGADHIAQFQGLLATVGFDIERDFFSWWSGEMISVSLPPAVVTPMGGSDWVKMVRVKDAEIAKQKIDSALNALTEQLLAHGQTVMISDSSLDGFRQVTHQMLAMFIRPVIGIRGEWLIVGSSDSAVKRCMDVAAGKAPSIASNKRFQAEGLLPEGAVLSASFTDTSNFGQGIAQGLAMAGMIGGMATAGIPDEEGKKMAQRIMTMLMKLGPVFQKMDFFSSESSITTYDGASILLKERIVTYKSPTAGNSTTAQRD